MIAHVLSAWLPWEKMGCWDLFHVFDLCLLHRSGPFSNCSFIFSLHATVRATNRVQFLNDLQCCIRDTSAILPNHTPAKSQLHLCIRMQASTELWAQNSLWMDAKQNSVWLWLCQISTCLHGDKTWNSAAWFACVSFWMHNASRPWII